VSKEKIDEARRGILTITPEALAATISEAMKNHDAVVLAAIRAEVAEGTKVIGDKIAAGNADLKSFVKVEIADANNTLLSSVGDLNRQLTKELKMEFEKGIKRMYGDLESKLSSMEESLSTSFTSSLEDLKGILSGVSESLLVLGKEIKCMSKVAEQIQVIERNCFSGSDLASAMQSLATMTSSIKEELDASSACDEETSRVLSAVRDQLSSMGMKVDAISDLQASMSLGIEGLASKISGMDSTMIEFALGQKEIKSQLDKLAKSSDNLLVMTRKVGKLNECPYLFLMLPYEPMSAKKVIYKISISLLCNEFVLEYTCSLIM
jgi:hypothetical protein